MSARQPLVLLHGFAGTGRAWDSVTAALGSERYLPIAPDLPGHGRAADVRPVSWEACMAVALGPVPPRLTLCDYSLGARVALRAALEHPERVWALVLVSGTAGIEDVAERERRRAADERLAGELETEDDIAAFAARWRRQPLFEGEPPAVARRATEDHLRNAPRALAAVLRGIGTGTMAPLWQRLAELEMPVTLVAGKRDERYVALARRMAAAIPRARLEILAAGHSCHLECPSEVAHAIESVS